MLHGGALLNPSQCGRRASSGHIRLPVERNELHPVDQPSAGRRAESLGAR